MSRAYLCACHARSHGNSEAIHTRALYELHRFGGHGKGGVTIDGVVVAHAHVVKLSLHLSTDSMHDAHELGGLRVLLERQLRATFWSSGILTGSQTGGEKGQAEGPGRGKHFRKPKR